MIYFACHNCQEPLDAPESMRGQRIECPACGKLTGVAEPPKTISAMSVVVCPRCQNSALTGYRQGYSAGLGGLGLLGAVVLILIVWGSLFQATPETVFQEIELILIIITWAVVILPFGLMFGFLNAEKPRVLCLNCGHEWRPKQKRK